MHIIFIGYNTTVPTPIKQAYFKCLNYAPLCDLYQEVTSYIYMQSLRVYSSKSDYVCNMRDYGSVFSRISPLGEPGIWALVQVHNYIKQLK